MKNNNGINENSRGINIYAPDEKLLTENRMALPRVESVSFLTGDEFRKGNANILDQVDEFFKSVGRNVHRSDLGNIELSRQGIRDDLAHKFGRLKAIAFKSVPDVLAKGQIIEYTKNHKSRNYDTAIIAAPINIGTERHYVAAVVRRNIYEVKTNITQRFCLHEVFTNKKTSELFKTVNQILQ